ncbi:MAG: folate-binding protein [Cyanobacteria bacterium J06635_1]
MKNAYKAAQAQAAVVDCSDWGRVRVSEADRIRFLHNQTTNDFQGLQTGQGCETVFVNSTARTLDLVGAYVDTESVLLLTSPGLQTQLIEWMDRYIFFADKVKLADVTDQTFAFRVIGPQAAETLAQLGIANQVGGLTSPGQHTEVTLMEAPVKVAVGCGLALPGYTLIGPQDQAETIWQALTTAGAAVLDISDWERLRIEQGRPLPGQELTEDDNPLEAGLWHAISFEKGCYIGQETIARLNTYQGVKKQLWGLKLGEIAPVGSDITYQGDKIGRLTSVTDTPDGPIGLGYIRTKSGGAGITVLIGETTATVVDVPFLSRGYLAS